MNFHHIATGLVTGLAAGAIAAEPIVSAANPSTATGRTTSIDTKGHNAIVVHPPTVSAPKSYGQFSSPQPFMFFD